MTEPNSSSLRRIKINSRCQLCEVKKHASHGKCATLWQDPFSKSKRRVTAARPSKFYQVVFGGILGSDDGSHGGRSVRGLGHGAREAVRRPRRRTRKFGRVSAAVKYFPRGILDRKKAKPQLVSGRDLDPG